MTDTLASSWDWEVSASALDHRHETDLTSRGTALLLGSHRRLRRQHHDADLSKKVAWGDVAQVAQRLRFLLH
jgi:hypothetical protein